MARRRGRARLDASTRADRLTVHGMDVLQILGAPGDGGAETYFVDLVTALARGGVPQAVALRAHAGRQAALKAANIPFDVLSFGGPLDWGTKPAIGRIAKAGGAKIALAWMNRAAKHTPAGPWARIGRLGGYYKLKNYRGFDRLVGNTADIRDYIVREGWPRDRAHYIPNFAKAGNEPALARASLDTPDGVPLLLGMGRLHSSKAHDVSLRALKRLPEAYLWIAGDGPEEANLKALANELGVAPRVRFLGWRDDPSALYRAADLCVFPSRFEPLGNVVIQAWAHRLPVIAAASKGPAALIRDGEDGVLIPIDHAEALATSVSALLNDSVRRAAFADAGEKRVNAEFSDGAVVAQWRALFAQYGVA